MWIVLRSLTVAMSLALHIAVFALFAMQADGKGGRCRQDSRASIANAMFGLTLRNQRMPLALYVMFKTQDMKCLLPGPLYLLVAVSRGLSTTMAKISEVPSVGNQP
jgi:hypothetical protein